jgi:hypothetical protein
MVYAFMGTRWILVRGESGRDQRRDFIEALSGVKYPPNKEFAKGLSAKDLTSLIAGNPKNLQIASSMICCFDRGP